MSKPPSKNKKQIKRPRRVWIFIADSRNKQDLSDLDHLDAILWGSNPHTRQGDLVLMYRSAPFSDIAYIFTAASNPRPAASSDRVDAKYVIQLSDKVPLMRPVNLKRIRDTSTLSKWSFARTAQGVMRRRKDLVEEGAWMSLRSLIIKGNPYVSRILRAVTPPKNRSLKKPRKVSGTISRKRPLKAFISYGSPDLKRVERLYRKLRKLGWVEPWFNKETNDLTAGAPWEQIVPEKIQSSDVVIICLSSNSVKKIGFFQTEIGRALLLQEQQPEGTSFISPIKLDDCEVPGRLAKWHCAELFRRRGFDDLVASLKRRAEFLAQAS